MPSLGRRDDLGLGRALGDRLLPVLVAAMAFLAALALGGVVGAGALALHWRGGDGASLTLLVPRPAEAAADAPAVSRLERAVALAGADAGVASARALDAGELAALLRPWLGDAPPAGLPVPAVVEVVLAPGADAGAIAAALTGALARAVPDASVESDAAWTGALARLAASLLACAWLVLGVVGAVAMLLIAATTRGLLLARREAIVVAHGLGATDGYVAAQFARHVAPRALGGAVLGALAGVPVLAGLARLAAPFAGAAEGGTVAGPWWATLPEPLWAALPAVPLAAGLIGLATTQATVRAWLRRLT